jgi:hypothetical protein
MMPGRRYSEGLHQALEAKEHVAIQPENVTLASITFQNYFRLYGKLAGMTGTAATEADEFAEIYKLDVVEIPTNQPVRRLDEDDEVYRTAEEKLRAIIREIEAANAKFQPMLVGTTSIEKSEQLAEAMKKRNITDRSQPEALQNFARRRTNRQNLGILNARFHEQGISSPKPFGHHRRERGWPRHRHSARRQCGMRVAQEMLPPQGWREAETEIPGIGGNFRANDCRRRPLYHRHRTA